MANVIEQGLDGLYSMAVFQAENSSDKEIMEEFGKFGTVSKLNRVKNIVFVRYANQDEANLCYKSMQGHPKFVVKPGRQKAGSNDGARNKDFKGSEMNRNDSYRERRPDMIGSGDFNQPNAASTVKPKLIPFPAGEEETTQQPPTAKLVVMANLHPKMGQNNIYDLCRKAGGPPLHVAMKILKRPPYPNISYAYVYVKNDVEAQNIISAFNNLRLNGYKMVVALADKLTEDGKVLLSKK